MKLTLYRAKLNTVGKTSEQILYFYFGPKPEKKEVES